MFKYIVYATPMFLTYLFFKEGMRANSEFMTFLRNSGERSLEFRAFSAYESSVILSVLS